KGPLGSGTKLRMPDDQLFQYDSADLQSSAVTQLQKLATLIKRNPKATFSVEGYTDSFGPPEYNLDLSQRRADSVKRYLVEVMGIDPAQIDARGYGQTKFRVSPNGSIEEQSPNRRVEIVVHTSEGQ
ncbi:MAG TPA: OmpA family protein, partial [Chthoniobacterales bacterium]|nr:OmpA family protein [Chthoniobacterales bacterium]